MTDRELLELAAKAASIELTWYADGTPMYQKWKYIDNTLTEWNPLTDDGDALRLAAKLRLEIAIHETYSGVINGNLIGGHVQHNDDPYAATRRAIVMAAAEVGKGMK